MSTLCCFGRSLEWVAKRSFYGGNLTRTVVHLEPKVEEALSASEYKAKRHPGRTTPKMVFLPDRFLKSASIVLQAYPVCTLREQATAFGQYLASRKPPLEESELHAQASAIEERLRHDVAAAASPLDQAEVDHERLEKMIRSKLKRKLQQYVYNWKPVDYNTYNGILYLIGRTAPDYAVLNSIFTELKSRVPEFQPKSILDFGSGVGTVLWSAHGVWSETIEEYFAVDASGDMNKIARLLLQDGREDDRPFIRGTFFRQFLPALHTLQYDIVASSFSLMELASRELRLQTLENLWAKTKHFLVVVENGSNAGYRLIMEARDFILQTTTSDAHVFAPCPHNSTCPKKSSGFPCNFQVDYLPCLSKNEEKRTARFSYVVFQKGKRPDGDAWPRIVGPVLPRHHHVVCRMCCSDGQLKEAVVTKSKSSRSLYKCTRASRWGDILPVSCQEQFDSDIDS